MEKGRKYIEPVTGRGDEVKKTKKPKKESGKTWDGISRPANNDYRENWMRIFNEKK
jgi:hypothetical protein